MPIAHDARQPRPPGFGWLLLLGCLACAESASPAGPSTPGFTLDIQLHPQSLARISARVDLPGPPEAAWAVLTDYEHWPALFPPGLRIVGIRREPSGVVTDLWAARHLLPGELHLVTETRETAPGLLETRFIEGDFHRYSRTWRLSTGLTAQVTVATLEMDVQPKGWAPDWLLTTFLRRDLEEHFIRLQAAVAARHKP